MAFILIFVLLAYPSFARIIWKGLPSKLVALTFDDGPSDKYTGKVLDILKKGGVKATFFVIGKKAADNLDLLKRIAKDGHELGNHTFNHARLNWLSDDKLRDELRTTSEIIKANTRKDVKYFRPPNGFLTREKRVLAEKSGYDIVLWSVHADDYTHELSGLRDPGSITRRVNALVKGGDIVLMHDISWQVVEALPGIVSSLKKRGYKFVTVSQLVEHEKRAEKQQAVRKKKV